VKGGISAHGMLLRLKDDLELTLRLSPVEVTASFWFSCFAIPVTQHPAQLGNPPVHGGPNGWLLTSSEFAEIGGK